MSTDTLYRTHQLDLPVTPTFTSEIGHGIGSSHRHLQPRRPIEKLSRDSSRDCATCNIDDEGRNSSLDSRTRDSKRVCGSNNIRARDCSIRCRSTGIRKNLAGNTLARNTLAHLQNLW